MLIKTAEVAGWFYAAHAERLRRQVQACLHRSPAALVNPRALIVPHAAHRYSGTVAGAAYACLQASDVRRVLILGPAHRVAFRGAALPAADYFQTPLGLLPVDGRLREDFAAVPGAMVRDDVFAMEHCIEVQLPFLQCLPGEFAILPILTGALAPATLAAAIAAQLQRPDTLVIVSSDLSHFLDYQQARATDLATLDSITRHEHAALDGERACGYRALQALLLAAGGLDLRARVLRYLNSGDTGGDRRRVVGYGAVALH